MAGRPKLDPEDSTEVLSVRVPAGLKDELWNIGGGGRGSISRALRKLCDAEVARRASQSKTKQPAR